MVVVAADQTRGRIYSRIYRRFINNQPGWAAIITDTVVGTVRDRSATGTLVWSQELLYVKMRTHPTELTQSTFLLVYPRLRDHAFI
jgi:hypothetical protein